MRYQPFLIHYLSKEKKKSNLLFIRIPYFELQWGNKIQNRHKVLENEDL